MMGLPLCVPEGGDLIILIVIIGGVIHVGL